MLLATVTLLLLLDSNINLAVNELGNTLTQVNADVLDNGLMLGLQHFDLDVAALVELIRA